VYTVAPAGEGLGVRVLEYFHVTSVRDVNPQMDDDDIIAWAVRENRIIITTDTDFEQMIWQQ